MAPHLIGLLLALSGCQPFDPLDPLIDAVDRPIPVSQREGLPDRFVSVVLGPHHAKLVGVRVSVDDRDLVLDPQLSPMIFGALFAELDSSSPLVLAVDRATEPALTQAAIDAAQSAGFAPLLGFSFGDGASEFPPPSALNALYADPADPRLFPDFAQALAAASGPVQIGPGLLSLHAERTMRRIQAGIERRSDRSPLVVDLLDAALRSDPQQAAVPWLATAATLGDVPLDRFPLPSEATEVASSGAARFRQQNRPVGLWSTSAELEAAYHQRLWLEQPLPDDVQRELRTILQDNDALLSRLSAVRAQHRLWHGPSTQPDPSSPEPGSMLGSPAPIRPDATGSVPARLAWARPVRSEPTAPLPTVVPLGATPDPVVLQPLFDTQHYQRSAEVYGWLSEQVGSTEARTPLIQIAQAYTKAGEGDPDVIGPRLVSTDIRLAEPTHWSARDRPTLRVVLGVRILPVSGGSRLLLDERITTSIDYLDTDELRARLDARPRASTLFSSR